MIERKELKFPSVLLQFLDSYFNSEHNENALKEILQLLSVTEQQFRDPEFFFDGDHLFTLLKLLKNSSINEPPSLQALRHITINNMGMAGVAGITARTLRDAYRVAIKFYKLLMPAAKLTPTETDTSLVITVELLADFESCNPILIELILGALKQFSDEATGKTLNSPLTFSHPPSWGNDPSLTLPLYQSYFNCPVEFNAPASTIRFDISHLNERLKSPNLVLHHYAKHVVDKELQERAPAASIKEKVIHTLSEALDRAEPLSLESTAAKLHMTSRTLSRKLAKENVQFKTLLNQVRFDQAKSLIKKTNLPMKQIAAKLGFSSTDAFSRAFKHHTGMTPSQLRINK